MQQNDTLILTEGKKYDFGIRIPGTNSFKLVPSIPVSMTW